MERLNPITNQFTSATNCEEGVEVVDLSDDVLVDSVTTMAQASIPPDLIVSADDNADDDDTRLTLAYENLYEVPRTIVERFSDHIKYLDISHNKITNLDTVVHFKHLTSLIADANPITENCNLPPLPKLQLLWLFLISKFPHLNHLDDRRVTEDENTEAHRLYKRPLVERLVSPGSGGLSHLMHSSASWNALQNRISSLWTREKPGTRNLLI